MIIQYYASLEEWRTGICISAEFNADQFEDVYLGHVGTLEEILKDSPDKYHRLMADIYAAVWYVLCFTCTFYS